MKLVMRFAAVIVTLLAALGLREATLVSWSTIAADKARVRQSWSVHPERVENCRRLSDAELEQLPAHMRMRVQCEGGFARYALAVFIDGRRMVADTLRGGGLRHDRPIHLFEEFEVPAGNRRLRIEVARLDSSAQRPNDLESGAGQADTLLGFRASREMDERTRRAAEAVPPHLVLDTTLAIPARHVLLVTYDETTRRLVSRLGN